MSPAGPIWRRPLSWQPTVAANGSASVICRLLDAERSPHNSGDPPCHLPGENGSRNTHSPAEPYRKSISSAAPGFNDR